MNNLYGLLITIQYIWFHYRSDANMSMAFPPSAILSNSQDKFEQLTTICNDLSDSVALDPNEHFFYETIDARKLGRIDLSGAGRFLALNSNLSSFGA